MTNSIFKYRGQILKKPLAVLTTLYLVINVILLVVGISYYNYEKEKVINDRFAYLESISDFKKSQINDWLKERYAQLEVLRADSPLINKLGTLTSNSSKELKEWFEALKTFYKYDDIILVGPSKKIIYSIYSENAKLNNLDSLLCESSSNSNSIVFSDSDEKFASPEFLKFYVPLGYTTNIPFKAKDVLIFSVEPNKIFNAMLNRNIDKSPTLETLLVKPYKEGIVYLNTLKFDVEGKENNHSANRKALIKANTMKSRRGFIDGVDYKNDEVIALMNRVPSSIWTLITKINQSEFYAPVNNLAKIVFLAIISADLLFAVVFFFIWRKSILANYKKMYAAEIEKSKLENRFESLVNGVKDLAIFIMDSKGNITSWNEGAEIIEGYSSDEIIGKNFSTFYSEEENRNNRPSKNLMLALEKGSYQEEGWRIKKDGTAFWANVLLTALQDENGKVYGFLKVTRDLTEKKRNEEEIKKSRDFYLKLLDDFPTPVWRSGLDGKFNYLNKAWLNYVGRKIEDENGDGWTSNLHPDERENTVKLYHESFRQRKSFTLEHRLKDSIGEYRWMINFGMPYSDMENNFAGYLGSCYDIDDRKKYEETINTLLRIGERLYSSLEINQILDSLVTESIHLASAESGFACIKNEDEFVIGRYYHKDHWEYYDKKYRVEDKILKQFGSNREPILANEQANQENIDQELVNRYSVRQAISTPLFGSNGELMGFFEIHNKKGNKGFTKDDINLLTAVARNASISIAKSLNYEQLRKAETQLRNSESELRSLAAQIQYARETERQHIAREVHDELGQLFTGINLNISLLTEMIEQNQEPSVSEIIDELHSVQQFVNKGIQTVRDISGSLRSYVLDHLGLIPAVQEYCREIERMSNVTCNFKSEVESFNFNDEKNVALFRIIQEAITNVLRHAEATVINVMISQREGSLEIGITDNGKGMPESKEAITNSMGILGMKERAIFLKGKLKIDSVTNEGTKIHLSIPVEKL
ncbi:MAG: PAS domain S-box protein [Ignavibacteriales bacterium]|nr:PAS domain S-box protein [Ignavibacteriales bacterium]